MRIGSLVFLFIYFEISLPDVPQQGISIGSISYLKYDPPKSKAMINTFLFFSQ